MRLTLRILCKLYRGSTYIENFDKLRIGAHDHLGRCSKVDDAKVLLLLDVALISWGVQAVLGHPGGGSNQGHLPDYVVRGLNSLDNIPVLELEGIYTLTLL